MKVHSIDVYGDIGFYDYDYDRTLDGTWMTQQLADVPIDVAKLEVNINSFGGITAEGLTMYNRLRDFARKRRLIDQNFLIETHIHGYAYSAGSVIALAGDKVIMHPGTQLMIHNAMGGEFGDYRAMQSASEWLKKTSQSVAELYVAETGLKIDDVKEMMDNTTFFTVAEAIAAGFADEAASVKIEKDTSLYKGVDPRPLNYAKYVSSPTYKSVSYERPPEQKRSQQSSTSKAAAKAICSGLADLLN